jgi:hypothetical protein
MVVMSISTAADDAQRLIVATAIGDLTVSEVQAFLRTARAGEQRDWQLLFDATAATMPLTAADVQSLAMRVGRALRDEGPRAPVAIVAPDDALFGMMRMYQMLCENQGVTQIHVCRTRAEAETWLHAMRTE